VYRHRRREGSSCHGQNLVADKVKADSLRPRPIEKERGGCLNRVLAQLLPRIPLRENVLGKAFGAIAAVGFLDNLEQQ
jgi:hypothetical protein